ncbi:MAG TPA: secretin N-terminal domain-containing protein [Tepidisphaeraceae bacterium]|jgi:type IV pilus secretin PilQ/predicted competence protein
MRICKHTTGILFLAACIGSARAADNGAIPIGAPTRAAEPASPFPPASAAPAATGQPAATTETASATPTTDPATQPIDQGNSVSANQVSVNDSGLVEIHVNDAPLVEVLRMLSLQSQKNIIASKDVTGTVTANLYDVTVQEALDEILKANGYRYREHGNFIEVYSQKEYDDMQKSERKAQTQLFRVHYTPAANVVNLIKPALSTEGVVSYTTPAVTGIDTGGSTGGAAPTGGGGGAPAAGGGGGSSGSTGGDSHATEDTIIVTDYPDNLAKIAEIIKQIDRRPDQILIEATILETTLTDNNSLGINFSALGGVDFNTLQNVGTTPFGALSGAILTGQTSSSSGSSGSSGAGSSSSGASAAGVGQMAANRYGGGSTSFNLPTGGLNVGLVTNNLGIFLSALESATNTSVVANPKLLVLNKQQGSILVGQQLGYLTTSNTETTSTQTVNFLPVGVQLNVRPFIGDDGYIRMEIHPENSTGYIDSNQIPQTATAEVTSNVMVKDGHTIVIGGLFADTSSTSTTQVPFFGDIPLIGYLFRTKTDTTSREEITVLLTPHIIHDEKAYADASQQEKEEGEKLRVGVRKDMMPFSKERLAEGEYEQALTELKKPVPDQCKVLWHLNAATDLNPTFAEAINLKENITGKVITDSDNSTIRSFVQRQILEEAINPVPRTIVPWQVAISPAPATQPVMVPVHTSANTAAPATPSAVTALPTTRPAVAEAPTTRPAVALVPTTRPAVAAVPAKQAAVARASALITQPTVASVPTTRPAVATANTKAQSFTPVAKPVVASVPTKRPTPAVASLPTTQPSVAALQTDEIGKK